VDRGSGCTPDGGGVSCSLDFFNSGLSASEDLNVRVTSLPATLTASVTSSPTGASDTGTWYGAAALTTPLTSSTPSTLSTSARAPVAAHSALSSVKATAPPHVARGKPVLTVSVRLARPAVLGLKLLDAKGRSLATWTRRAKAGATTLKLVLPPKARKVGRAALRVAAGGSTKTIRLVLRA
jgi:hypothetical protein